MQLQHILMLREQEGIHDILPVGSRGILAEADDLAQSVGCTFLSLPDTKVDLRKSAGPSTTLIFTCSRDTTLPSFPTGLCEHIGTLCADSP